MQTAEREELMMQTFGRLIKFDNEQLKVVNDVFIGIEIGCNLINTDDDEIKKGVN